MTNNLLLKRKTIRWSFFLFFFLSFSFLLPTPLAYIGAAGTSSYENQEKIPGKAATSDLVQYLQDIYSFGIAIAGILAVVMISFGAFSYIITSGGNSSKMLDAKDMITEAIFGLVLALVAYLLLFVLNPDLVNSTITKPAEVIK